MYFHLLTVILVTLKALDYITLSWWWCVAPSLVALAFALALVSGIVSLAAFAVFFDRKK